MHRERFRTSTLEQTKDRRDKVGAILATASLLLSGCSAIERPVPTVTATVPAEAPAPAPTMSTPTPPPGWDTLKTLVVDEPNGGNEYKFSVITIEQELIKAGEKLAEMTDNKITLPAKPVIDVIDLEPVGTYATSAGETAPCYTDSQLEQARERYLAQKHAPASRVAVVINQGKTCHGATGDAAAWAYPATGTTVYDVNFDHRVFLHEEGHLEGMGHAASITCRHIKELNMSMDEVSKIDIGELVSLGCDVQQRNKKGEKSMYSDTDTVMGGIPSIAEDAHDDLYSYIELNKLGPDIAKGETVLPSNGTYRLGRRAGETRFISLDLPAGHPLQKIDKDINKLSIGVVRKEASGNLILTELRLIAGTTNGQTYSLDFAMPYMLPFDKDLKDTVMYVDKMLGIELIANSNGHAESIDVAVKRLPVEK